MANKVPTHYEVLGVARNATQDEITKAYNSLIRKYNPREIREELAQYVKKIRLSGEKPFQGVMDEYERRINAAPELFLAVSIAYSVLSDVSSREFYDSVLEVEAEGESDAIVVLFDPAFIDFGHVKPVPGETFTATTKAILLTGDVSKKRIKFKAPEWLKFDFTATNGNFPFIVTLTIDSDELPDGVYDETFVLMVGDLKFDLDISLVIERKVNAIPKPASMVVVPEPPIPVINIPVSAAPAEQPAFNRSAWRGKVIPIFAVIAIIFVLSQILKNDPPNPFTDFCSRPVVSEVVGVHVNIVDNGLFMYGKLKGNFQINDKTYAVDSIPNNLVVSEFPKQVILLDVTVTSGPHEGEKSSCNKELYSK